MDLPTLANIASLVCLPASLVGAISLLLGLSGSGRDFMKNHPRWIFVGLVFLVVLCVADLTARLGLSPSSDLALVFNQTYTNQMVEIDNKEFHNCTFENATLRYNGGPFQNSRFAHFWVSTSRDDK